MKAQIKVNVNLKENLQLFTEKYIYPGYHYVSGESQLSREEMIRLFPDRQKTINTVFDLMGELSNLHNIHHSKEGGSEKYRITEQKLKDILNKIPKNITTSVTNIEIEEIREEIQGNESSIMEQT